MRAVGSARSEFADFLGGSDRRGGCRGGRDRVDLYGYASLAIATLQLPQRQSAALQAEVDRLTAQTNTSPMCGP